MKKIIPCLWFDKEAEEAAKYYTSIFENSRILDVSHYAKGMPREGDVLTVNFELKGQEIVALNGGPEFKFTEAISLQIPCDDQAEVDKYWSQLTDGGEEGPCGWLKDRYGLSWQVFPTRLVELITDPDPDRSQRAMEAMMQMKKIDIETVEKAAAG